MTMGSGCTVHMKKDELPDGDLIVSLSRHITCVKDGTIYDTYDPSRDGTRCVYGYWTAPKMIIKDNQHISRKDLL